MTEGLRPGEASALPSGTRYRVRRLAPLYLAGTFVLYLFYIPVFIVFSRVAFGLKTEGRGHLRRMGKRGCVLVSNHSLYFDPVIVLATVAPRMVFFSAQLSHFKNPAFAAFLRWLGTFPITGRAGLRKVESMMRDALDRGRCIHFFPEGVMTHRSQTVLPFRNGAFYFATQLGVPVVPVTLVHRPRRLFGREISKNFLQVKCIVGEPVEPETGGNGSREDAARLADRVYRIMVETITSEHERSR